ncbi:MAG: hypothetical protein JXM70_15475 [Pirellulales bacterium]|nr:hypothetical protein [Pirellulales bacterium]
MKIINIHERELHATAKQAGALIDSLASKDDGLWPVHSWPRMELDRPLEVGAVGGHGPIRYYVEEYTRGQSIKFRLTRPKGFDGLHRYEVIEQTQSSVILRHTIEMSIHGIAVLTWPVIIRPLHDALLEDSLATAQASLGFEPLMKKWSAWVKLLKWTMSGGKARSQSTPAKATRNA